ncbi:MAG TPA: bifunctional 4-hydroxy-2-oxoglutarate aldolase/2-dehydro-3-deoxy-phosphogluconate aldolase [Chloroflexi bacterium]|nr:bifunctional 4-hydroxy-2-oxoglutarate aldolase/2-dehydro-3-deoxy-phosphogluconate aldolase [Chloroflexota bacterium]HPO57632.1 bifunctional 4-hydroxy-2-oxoglutarate aldolase/2-dehydro-3-deoxy-phosphogluconate aldolase [Anaerolineaceae bacterium]
MDKQAVLDRIESLGLLAVLRGPSPELTVRMVEALAAGGVYGIEITYSTPNAEAVVAELAEKFGDRILLGMGTLIRPEQAASAKAAGAQFLVSPVCDPELVRAMVATGLPVMAGALTPTEVLQAHQLGSDVVKIFPGSMTGPSYIKALKGPFPYIRMMPTGGVNAGNIADWFAAGVVAVGAGSELCPPKLAKEGRFDEISERAREFVRIVEAARAPQAK